MKYLFKIPEIYLSYAVIQYQLIKVLFKLGEQHCINQQREQNQGPALTLLRQKLEEKINRVSFHTSTVFFLCYNKLTLLLEC